MTATSATQNLDHLLDRMFGLSKSGSDLRTEFVAGLTTFLTMVYIVFVNPQLGRGALAPLLSTLMMRPRRRSFIWGAISRINRTVEGNARTSFSRPSPAPSYTPRVRGAA